MIIGLETFGLAAFRSTDRSRRPLKDVLIVCWLFFIIIIIILLAVHNDDLMVKIRFDARDHYWPVCQVLIRAA